MNKSYLIFTEFSGLVGILILAVCSNALVYAQQQLPSNLVSKPKAIMCDPSNPDLKVVNTTESRLCGIPKTVKPQLSSASSQTFPVSSSAGATSQRTSTTSVKPATISSAVDTYETPPKVHQVVGTTNNNAVFPSTGFVTWATIASIANPSNTVSSSPSQPSSTASSASSSSAIAPQITAVNQQQQPQQPQQQPLIPIAALNSTTGQNYTFAAASAAPTTGLLQLGYDGVNSHTYSSGNGGSRHHSDTDNKDPTPRIITIRSNNDDSRIQKHKDKADTKSHAAAPIHRKLTSADNGSEDKKKTTTSSSKLAKANSDGTHSGRQSSDLASSIEDKVNSIIKNAIGKGRDSFFGEDNFFDDNE